jgi:hypothetical protein
MGADLQLDLSRAFWKVCHRNQPEECRGFELALGYAWLGTNSDKSSDIELGGRRLRAAATYWYGHWGPTLRYERLSAELTDRIHSTEVNQAWNKLAVSMRMEATHTKDFELFGEGGASFGGPAGARTDYFARYGVRYSMLFLYGEGRQSAIFTKGTVDGTLKPGFTMSIVFGIGLPILEQLD